MGGKLFKMRHSLFGGEEFFTEESAPDWLTSAKTIKGSTMDGRWFWEMVVGLAIGKSIDADFRTITRVR